MEILKVKIFETLFGKKARFVGIAKLPRRQTLAHPGNYHPNPQLALDTKSMKHVLPLKHQDEIPA